MRKSQAQEAFAQWQTARCSIAQLDHQHATMHCFRLHQLSLRNKLTAASQELTSLLCAMSSHLQCSAAVVHQFLAMIQLTAGASSQLHC